MSAPTTSEKTSVARTPIDVESRPLPAHIVRALLAAVGSLDANDQDVVGSTSVVGLTELVRRVVAGSVIVTGIVTEDVRVTEKDMGYEDVA